MELSRRTLLGGCAALGLALGGCGRGSNDPLAGKSAAPPTEPVEIEWLAQSLDANDGSDLRRILVDAFQKAHPNITVRIAKAPPTSDVQRATLTTQIASGASRPDVYLGDCAWPAQFAHNALVMPLEELVEPGFWSDFSEPVLSSLTYEGQRWAFPMYLSESFLYFRQDLLAKHDMPAPRTWEELARSGRALAEAGDVRYGFVWQGASSETLTANVMEFVADAGGRLVAEDRESAAIDSPAGRRALEFIEHLVDSGVSPRSVATFSEQESLTTFAAGEAAFLRNWNYAWGSVNPAAGSPVAGKVRTSLRPTFSGSGRNGLSTVGGWHNFLNPHTRHLGAALQFARWISGPEAQLLMATSSPYLPASLQALNAPETRAQNNPMFDLATKVDLAPRPTRTPHYPQVSEAVYTNVNPVITGASGTRGVLDEISEQINRALDGAAL